MTNNDDLIDSEALAPVPATWGATEIVGATIQIGNTGAGLDKGLEMPPVQVLPGHTVDVVLRCTLGEHRVDYLNERGTEGMWVNRLRAEHATIVGAGEVASEALDRAEERVKKRKSEIERRKREEAGEVPLFDDDGAPRGGDPEQVGQVLGGVDAIADIAEEAEARDNWRNARTKELDTFSKDGLIELAGHPDYEIVGRHGMNKSELVDAIVDVEDAARGEDGDIDA